MGRIRQYPKRRCGRCGENRAWKEGSFCDDCKRDRIEASKQGGESLRDFRKRLKGSN